MYAYPDQRFRLKEKIGKVEPNDIGINKLFCCHTVHLITLFFLV